MSRNKEFRIVRQGKKYAVQRKTISVEVVKKEPNPFCPLLIPLFGKNKYEAKVTPRWAHIFPSITYPSKKEATEALQRIMWECVETKDTQMEDSGKWEVV